MAADPNDYQAAMQRCREVLNRQSAIDTLQTDGRLIFKNHTSGKESEFDFAFYYHVPDFTHLTSKSFIILPAQAVDSLRPDFFRLEDYTIDEITPVGEEGRVYLLKLSPRKAKVKYSVILRLDLEQEAIQRAEISFEIPEPAAQSYTLKMKFEQIGRYSLPVEVEGEIPIPGKYDMSGKVSDYQQGSIQLTLDNTRVNQDLPVFIMKEYRQAQEKDTRQ